MSLPEGGVGRALAASACLLMLLCAISACEPSSGITFSERLPVKGGEVPVHGICYPVFSDSYRMLARDSLSDEEPAVVGVWQGHSIEMVRGQKADYYHVLGTWLVSIQEKSSEPAPAGEEQPEHPAEGLQGNESSVPAYLPDPNEGRVITGLAEMQALERGELLSRFGSAPAARSNQSQIWAYYNGAWTEAPAAVRQHQQMNLVAKSGLVQPIWLFDSAGSPEWSYWGEIGPGFIPFTFSAESKGWHAVRVWGGSTGFSNVLAIYVW